MHPATISNLKDSTSEDSDTGAVRSVQTADLSMPERVLRELWLPVNLERLARTYWRFLQRVTLGLVRVRYTPTGRVQFSASWGGDDGNRHLCLGVEDTGAGISPEEQESIFQPFERGSAGKGDSSGGSALGLGALAAIASAVARHGWALPSRPMLLVHSQPATSSNGRHRASLVTSMPR